MVTRENSMDLAGMDLTVNTLYVGATRHGVAGTQISGSEFLQLDGITAGTVSASKALIVDASKNISQLATVGVTDLDAGSSGVAGSVDIFPSAASKGKLTLSATANTGNTNVTITNAAMAGTRNITIPDSGGTNSSFVLTAGAQTLAGALTLNATPVLGAGTTIDLDSGTATLVSNATTLTKYAGVITTESLTTAAGSSQALTLTLTGVAAGDMAFVQYQGAGTNTRRGIQIGAVTTSNTLTVTLYNIEPTNALNGTVVFNFWILKA